MNEYTQICAILNSVINNGDNLNQELLITKEHEKKAKITNTVYGVIRNYFSINFIIDNLTKQVNKETRLILQIGIYELMFSYKPEYAVINELVGFSSVNNQKIKNFVNAVLRNYVRKKQELGLLIQKDFMLKYNIPNWLINKLKEQKKETYLNILNGLNCHPAFGIRINLQKIKQAEYLEKLDDVKIKYQLVDQKICLLQALNVNELPGFNEGLVSVQDIAAQYMVDMLQHNKTKANLVLDACAAPGGKACQLLENMDATLVALDIDKERLIKIKQNLVRLQLSANLVQGDARLQNWWNGEKFDLILADVPCSATGTIKRNPDIKINRYEEDIQNFVFQQRQIINNLWSMLKENGYLLYITCSLLNEENQDNVNWFKNNLAMFNLVEELQILPTEFNDSLYYALIYKGDVDKNEKS